jgi:hypothetical protein
MKVLAFCLLSSLLWSLGTSSTPSFVTIGFQQITYPAPKVEQSPSQFGIQARVQPYRNHLDHFARRSRRSRPVDGCRVLHCH